MSGIAACIRTDGHPVEPGLIEAMTQAISHCGPDGISHLAKGAAVLGHCLLATTAEAENERQPLTSNDGGVLIVMDGYLTNWDELRRTLQQRGANLRTHSDAELVLHAYEQWGSDCPRHIDGEFAFVVWDARRASVFCARDHQGLRPLFYHWDGKALLIASEVKAILAALTQPLPLNHGFIAEVLTNQWYTRDETVWTGIQRLLPAHSLQLNDAGPAMEEYWTLPLDVSIRYKTDAEYVEHYRELLADCVRRSARTHRPLAFEVSGGLDSTSLFCMAHRLAADGQLPAPDLHGYTLAGPAGSHADEVEYARATASALNVPVREVPLFMPELEWFSRFARESRDIPPFPNTAMSIDLERALIADGCRVCINGVGGDQWLDGSPYYYRELLADRDWHRLGSQMRADLSAQGLRRTAHLLLHYGLSPLLTPGARQIARSVKGIFKREPGAEAEAWLNPQIEEELAGRQERYLRSLPDDPAARLKIGKLAYPYLATMFDMNARQYARSGVDARHPMLARSFIEFSAATPEHIKMQGGETKVLHRRAMQGILPDKIIKRTSKAEFSATYFCHDQELADLFTKELDPQMASLLDPDHALFIIERYIDAELDNKTASDIWAVFLATQLLKL